LAHIDQPRWRGKAVGNGRVTGREGSSSASARGEWQRSRRECPPGQRQRAA